jgi:hypothetical protein
MTKKGTSAATAAKVKEIVKDTPEEEFSDEQLASLAVLAAKVEHLPRSKEVTAELLEVNLRLRHAINDYDDLVLPFVVKTKEHLKSIRDTRMSLIPEVAQMMNSLRDVRKFFLDKDYKEEMTRLREFVELCERLKVLKDSGFLDSIADTMLKLEQVKP